MRNPEVEEISRILHPVLIIGVLGCVPANLVLNDSTDLSEGFEVLQLWSLLEISDPALCLVIG